jgi:probable HAF family extracellular repeat protein
MFDLNDLLLNASGWTLTEAAAINDNGQIVGLGRNGLGQTEAFLLTPVPLPGTQRSVCQISQ